MKRTNRELTTLVDHIYRMDYKERPVSIRQFLCDNEFLGNTTGGEKNVYKSWIRELSQCFRDNRKYINVLSGAIGTGKTRAAIWGMLYTMYKVLLLRDPWGYFGKASGDQMAVVFFNLTKTLGKSKGFQLLQAHLLESPWFLGHGKVCGTSENPRVDFDLLEYALGSGFSKGFGTQGTSIICAIMDEVDSPFESEGQKKRIISAYENSIRRFKSRFVHESDNRTIGRFFLVASKQETASFLNVFVTKMRGSKNVHIIEMPKWEASDNVKLCGEKFPVLVGDAYDESRIIKSEEEEKRVVKEGQRIVHIPVEFRDDFDRDVEGSLRDIAGIAATYMRKRKLFNSSMLVRRCMDEQIPRPVKKLTIVAGLHDRLDLMHYVDVNLIPNPPHLPRYIHQDISFSGDCMGVAMSCIVGWKKVTREREDDGEMVAYKEPVVQTELILRCKARKKDRFPLSSVRKFVLDLRDTYKFNIMQFSADLRLLSEDTKQFLEKRGITCAWFSLDKDPQVYRNFRDLVEEQRWICYQNPILAFELENLEDDPEKNKIDHPKEVETTQIMQDESVREVVVKGSKDVSDAVAGSVMQAIKLTEEPPDVERISRMMDRIVSTGGQDHDPLWWLETGNKKHGEVDGDGLSSNTMNTVEMDKFGDILRRATGKG